MSLPVVTQDAKPPTDSYALNIRLDAYEKYSDKDINSVLDPYITRFQDASNVSILDVGCGRGKQTEYLLNALPNANIHSFDASEDSINNIKTLFPDSICAQVIDYNNNDQLLSFLNSAGGKFDLITSFYSIYYANDVGALLQTLREFLQPNGVLVLVGYSQYNNKELVEFYENDKRQQFETADF